MYVPEILIKERQKERLRLAQEQRAARRAASLRRLEKRSARAEREILAAWRRVEQLRSMLEAAYDPGS